MATKSILLAIADSQALADISQALGTEWMPTTVSSPAEALAQLEKYSFDALLVDFNLGSPDASELLNHALEKRPETIRFLFAYEADLALVAAKVLGEHQILPKPIEFASLKRRIEEGAAPEDSSGKQSESDAAADAGVAPKIPAVYSEVLKAFDSPEVTTTQVGEIIARDATLRAEVLRLANSVYLGVPRSMTDPVEAVGSLGLETVRGLVMALRFLAENSHLKPGYLSFDKLWQHSTNVALIARDLVLFETKDRALASQAFVAGLVHDLGKVTLVTNFDDLYGRVHSLARKQPVALWDAEKEFFGASHGEIGGCLVGMWNLPPPVVEATAYHHEPPVGENQQLTPLAVVHIANVLEHELGQSDEFRVAPVMDPRVLNELGLLQRLPVWRAALANGCRADTGPEFDSAETKPTRGLELSGTTPTSTANQLPGPVTATRTTTSADREPDQEMSAVPVPGYRQRRWVYAGTVATLLLLVSFWLGTQSLNQPLPINARTPTVAPVHVISPSSPETTPAAAARVATETPATPEPPAADPPTATLVLSGPEPEPTEASPWPVITDEAPPADAATAPPAALSGPEPEPTPAIAAQVTAPLAAISHVPSPTVARPDEPRPDFRLNGVIYTPARPIAIVNGRTVCVGSQVDGATVLSIGLNHVTLQVNGQTKTCVLR